MNSGPNHINIEDLKRWGRNALIFSSPALIILLSSLSTGTDPKIAIGAMGQALCAAAIDFLRKYRADNS